MMKDKNIISRITLLLALLICVPSGCIMPPATSNPMEFVFVEKTPGQQSKRLFVFLPGRFDEPDDFVRNGFLNQMWSKGVDADAIIADAHLGYYYEQIFDQRLFADVIQPMKSKGYQEIWAVGVSLGGFGAIMFERDFPGTWDGVILIAPFVGDEEPILKSIRQADSLNSVQFSETRTDDDYTANFWSWIQDYQAAEDLPIFVGLGTDDRMIKDQLVMAGCMDANRVIQSPGGHNWNVWKGLWGELLDLWMDDYQF